MKYCPRCGYKLEPSIYESISCTTSKAILVRQYTICPKCRYVITEEHECIMSSVSILDRLSSIGEKIGSIIKRKFKGD